MKKSLFVILFSIIVAKGFGQFFIPFSFPNSVDLFGLFELSFKIPWTFSNPYDPDTINIYAEFTGPDNSSYTVNAFYYEDYTFQQNAGGYEEATHNPIYDGWRIRFTPTVVGTWTFNVKAFDKNGELNFPILNTNLTFACASVSNADGFISMANSKFLKREIVRNGHRQYHSFFPIGPDEAWYSCIVDIYGEYWNRPIGIYEYKRRMDSLSGNANYIRVFLNRYQYLSLYGPEYTQLVNGNPIVYFDSTINQKDSAELDFVIANALQQGISIMPCVFSCGDFMAENHMDPSDPSIWANNPYSGILEGTDPCACDFFTNDRAIKISKNLIRYIASRWGYATNIMCWELWNEVDHVKDQCNRNQGIDQQILDWHNEMVVYLQNVDPFNHCVSSSIGNVSDNLCLYSQLYNNLDFVQQHHYESIQNAELRHQLLYRLYNRIVENHNQYPNKPFFWGEFGFGQNQNTPKYADKDPFGIDLHNTLWSSLFFTSMGSASFWWWNYVDECNLYHHFTPLLTFCKKVSIPSESFTAHHTGTIVEHKLLFDNGLQTFYMINETQDTIYGWSQDTAFTYQSLRKLTDSVHTEQTIWGPVLRFKPNAVYDSLGYVYTLNPSKRPAPSSSSNMITLPITNQPVGKTYKLKWYDSETGSPFNVVTMGIPVQQDSQGKKYLTFQFPSHIRDIHQHTINNTFGDAVFILVQCDLGEPSPKK